MVTSMVAKALRTSTWHEWGTPHEIFDPLQKEFGPFDLDPAASAWNAKAPKFFTKDQDGLSKIWRGRVWLNPPYGKGLEDWIRKAHFETSEGKASVIVVIVPARTDTRWWHRWVIGKAEIRFLYGRFRFLLEDGTKARRCPFPVVVLIYRRN
jgi:site-specific DNA-methyltransferase (adenine-specific)